MRLLVVLALIGAACAETHQNTRVIGGNIANIINYPYMTSMQFLWNQGFYHGCGGSLITTIAVLSTATCFERNLVASNWQARLGSATLSTGGTAIKVSNFVLHPNFNSALSMNDVAIIRLTTIVTLSNTINIARIAGPNYTIPDDLLVYTAGWGRYTSDVFGGLSSVLRHVDVRVVNHALCTSRYADLRSQPGFEYIPNVWDDNLCTGLLGVGGQDACSGDMGGPVVHQGDILVGLTGWAFECGDPYYPRVNVRVTSHVQWIVENAS